MTSKEYLQQVYNIDRKIRLDKGKLAALRSALYSPTVSYDGDGVQNGTNENSTEKAMQRVIDYEARINAEIDELIQKRIEIENVIESVADDVQREILTRRYLLLQKWEQIAVEMNISLRWVYRLHGKALENVKTWQ